MHINTIKNDTARGGGRRGMATGRSVVVAAECCLLPTAATAEANRLAEKKNSKLNFFLNFILPYPATSSAVCGCFHRSSLLSSSLSCYQSHACHCCCQADCCIKYIYNEISILYCRRRLPRPIISGSSLSLS